MNKFNKMYFTMYDGEDLDNLCEFLEYNHIDYDLTGTGDVDYDGNAECDLVIFTKNKENVEKVSNFLTNI